MARCDAHNVASDARRGRWRWRMEMLVWGGVLVNLWRKWAKKWKFYKDSFFGGDTFMQLM